MDYLEIIITYTYDKSYGFVFERKAQKTVVYYYCKDVIIEKNRLTFKYFDSVTYGESWKTFDMSMNDIKRCHFVRGM